MLKQEIARNVSLAERRIQLRRILQVQAQKRSEDEVNELILALQGIEFFKKRQKLSNADLKDLACSLEYLKVSKNRNVV